MAWNPHFAANSVDSGLGEGQAGQLSNPITSSFVVGSFERFAELPQCFERLELSASRYFCLFLLRGADSSEVK